MPLLFQYKNRVKKIETSLIASGSWSKAGMQHAPNMYSKSLTWLEKPFHVPAEVDVEEESQILPITPLK